MGRKSFRDKPMKLITLHMPEELVREIDELVAKGVFPSRSEAIRYAVVKLLADIRYKELFNKYGDSALLG